MWGLAGGAEGFGGGREGVEGPVGRSVIHELVV